MVETRRHVFSLSAYDETVKREKEAKTMSQEKAETKSPFSALTYQEQQDQWLAWRSKQLDYQPVSNEPGKQETSRPSVPQAEMPRLRLPNMRIAAPTRHQELDQVINRHRQALKQAGAFQTTSID